MYLRIQLVSLIYYNIIGTKDPLDLVGSALSDSYLSYSAALFGLAGPLHGYEFSEHAVALLNAFIVLLIKKFYDGSWPCKNLLEIILLPIASKNTCGRRSTLDKSFQGTASSPIFVFSLTLHRYGHGVLRSPDPRFIALQQFCDARPDLSSSPVIRLVKQVSLL